MNSLSAWLHSPSLPSRRVSTRTVCFLLTGLVFGFFVNPTIARDPAPETAVAVFTPKANHAEVTDDILSELRGSHYVDLSMNDSLSRKLLDSYLETLDVNRMYFLQSDVDGFRKYENELDDAIRDGDLDAPFEIFNVLQQRRVERQQLFITWMEKDLDSLTFDQDDEILVDRSKEPWLRTLDEVRELWRRQFKYDVLNLKLSEKNKEQTEEILGRRYTNQLRRIEQTRSRDVYQMFMSSFTHFYDPHTEYFPPREAENFDIRMSLSLEGIGALLQSDQEYTKIVRLIPGGPAEKGEDLKPADRIIGVAQGDEGEFTDIVGWRVDEVVELIRGPKGSVVRLQVLSANQTDPGLSRVIKITRDKVKLEEQAAKSEILELERKGKNLKVGVIDLPAFYMDFQAARRGDPNYRSSTRDVRKLVNELKKKKIDGLVMDLRNNGGGSLAEARELTGLFLRTGPIVQIRGAEGEVQVLTDPSPEVAYNGPLVVLVNRLSASASEIFAAAVQDYGRGVVVGGRTFGKGTVQNVRPLSDGENGQIKLTLAKFYRVSGGSTQNRGVVPDIPLPDYFDEDDIGESALPQAMPWDRIRALPVRKSTSVSSTLGALRRFHEKRINQDPEFDYIYDRLNHRAELNSKNTISLNYDRRIKSREASEKKLVEIENRRRAALGEEPIAKLSDLNPSTNEGKVEEKDAAASTEEKTITRSDDPLLWESANILLDFKALQDEEVVVR